MALRHLYHPLGKKRTARFYTQIEALDPSGPSLTQVMFACWAHGADGCDSLVDICLGSVGGSVSSGEHGLTQQQCCWFLLTLKAGTRQTEEPCSTMMSKVTLVMW
ncbi:uncharacterized protein ACO6RY_01197 [Pungitius sinensis]